MEFEDSELAKFDLTKPEVVADMVVRCLCGEESERELSNDEKELLARILSQAAKNGLSHAQFNEMLLLLNQDRVSEAFFRFFFRQEKVKLRNLRDGIIRFRGFALLCFGNFRFAYKQLIQANESELLELLSPYCLPPSSAEQRFSSRPGKALDIEKIPKDLTWRIGYVAQSRLKKEAEDLPGFVKSRTKLTTKERKRLGSFGVKLQQMVREQSYLQSRSLKNTDIYLTWDHIDVYVATSMRYSWEFEEAFGFIAKLFANKALKNLRLRHFDPTQSLCENRIDKGLVEGLMLKRAFCTIYMAQEYDTMGKDSELAATLAQGKPVIAYVPSIHPASHSKRIRGFPLDFFQRRILILRAEGLFEDRICRQALARVDKQFAQTLEAFLSKLQSYRSSQPFTLWKVMDDQFKSSNQNLFSRVCRLLAVAEHVNFDQRAFLLRNSHPLAIQVNLASGVANGVLVVRTVDQCARLLRGLLTNSLKFAVRHQTDKGKGVSVLEETITQCPFRVVTANDKLANCFWNFYLAR